MKSIVVEESYVQWNAVNCSAMDISALWCSDVLLRTTTLSALDFSTFQTSVLISAGQNSKIRHIMAHGIEQPLVYSV